MAKKKDKISEVSALSVEPTETTILEEAALEEPILEEPVLEESILEPTVAESEVISFAQNFSQTYYEPLVTDPMAQQSERNDSTMSCASVFIANNVSAPVATNAAVPLGTIQRRYGCALNASSSGVSISQRGYYLVNATITFTAPAAGVVAISLQDNGQQVVGVTAAESVTTANTEQHTIALTGIVRSLNGSDVLTLVNTGIACTPSIVSLNVVKL